MAFVMLAIAEMGVFYACYFFKLFIQKSKGIQTNQMGKGKEGFAKRIEVTLQISACLVPIVELISIFCLKSLSPVWVKWVGDLIGLAGVVLFLISVLTMKDSWRAGVSEREKIQLVTDGVYRISRNPAFLGFDFLYTGILCMFFNLPLLAVSAFAIILLHMQIVYVEEAFLTAAFGAEYLAYSKQVNRYFGRKG